MKTILLFSILCNLEIIIGQTLNSPLNQIQALIGNTEFRLANLDYALGRQEKFVYEAVRMASLQVDRMEGTYSENARGCASTTGIIEWIVNECLRDAMKNMYFAVRDTRIILDNTESKELEYSKLLKSGVTYAYQVHEEIKNDISQKIERCKIQTSEERVNDCLNNLIPDLKKKEEEMEKMITQQIESIYASMTVTNQNIENAMAAITQECEAQFQIICGEFEKCIHR
ncbi:hypothetical protein L9F63_009117 [Diploptera punctata]|uniref:Venom protein n=1 Tax=Diploptera punctata TaxID=6984 RepID=A0AAD8E108_DIPPU|nr:hypothetical protein L9F63_009117 [Diploptera punctata]